MQKEFSIYGLISFSGETKKKNKLDLIRPTKRLKFELIKDVYKNKIKFEFSKVHTKKSFNVVSNKVFNLGILRTKKKKMVGQKRPINEQIIDSIEILGIQNNDYNFLNPIYISITSDILIQKLTKYRKYRYRFVLQSFI